jgi:hypothetical protein
MGRPDEQFDPMGGHVAVRGSASIYSAVEPDRQRAGTRALVEDRCGRGRAGAVNRERGATTAARPNAWELDSRRPSRGHVSLLHRLRAVGTELGLGYKLI